MNDIQHILSALEKYTGELDSLNETTTVFKEELGENWTENIYAALGPLSPDQQERLDHAFNYYAAVTAWNEIQSYLVADPKTLTQNEIEERIPILEHWLAFFGEPGAAAVTQLQEKLAALTPQENALPPESEKQTPLQMSVNITATPTTSAQTELSDNIPLQNTEPAPISETQPDDSISNDSSALGETNASFQQSESEAQALEYSEALPAAPQTETREESAASFNITSSEDRSNTQIKTEINTLNGQESDEIREEEPILEAGEPVLSPEAPVIPVNRASENTDMPTTIENNSMFQPNSDERSALFSDQKETIETESYTQISEDAPTHEMSDKAPEPLLQQTSLPDETPFTQPSSHEEATTIGLTDQEAQNRDTNSEQLEDDTLVVSQEEPEEDNRFLPPDETPENPESWLIEKTFRQIDFIHDVQSWVAARCISLGRIETYTYKYYGFLIDVTRTVLKDIQFILAQQALYPLVESKQKNGVKYLQDTQLYLEQEIKSAEENCEGDIAPLIDETIDKDEIKRTLGFIDTSTTKEYLGPAPDGFEALDDPYESNTKTDTVIQKEYRKLEESLPAMEKSIEEQIESPTSQTGIQKTASQTLQNSVKRKMSFSFTRKKPVSE